MIPDTHILLFNFFNFKYSKLQTPNFFFKYLSIEIFNIIVILAVLIPE